MKKTDNYFIYASDFVERYRLDLKSETTINTYLEGLNSFRRFLCDSLDTRLECITFKLITSDVVRKYMKWLNDSGYSINTRNTRLTTIKQYLRFCAEKRTEFLSTNLDISSIKTKQSTPKTDNWLS